MFYFVYSPSLHSMFLRYCYGEFDKVCQQKLSYSPTDHGDASTHRRLANVNNISYVLLAAATSKQSESRKNLRPN